MIRLRITIPSHAKKQITKRGLLEDEVKRCIQFGEIAFEEIDERFGKKFASKIDFGNQYLFVIWKYNKKDEIEIITAYWRKKKWSGFVQNVE